MATNPSRVECDRCSAPAALTDPSCKSCGGRIVKLCGSCGWKLSAAKRYCDSCGEPQSGNAPASMQAPPGATPLPVNLTKLPPEKRHKPAEAPEEKPKKLKPIPETSDGLPRTVIRRLDDAPKDAGKKVDEPPVRRGKREPSSERKRESKDRERRRERSAPKKAAKPKPAGRRRPILSTLAGVALLVGGGLLYGYYWFFRRTPERLLKNTARRYLTALRDNDYKTAHSFLTKDARRSCTVERFRSLQETKPWGFDKIQIRFRDEKSALVRYELRMPEKAPSKDWMHFHFEKGKWRRAYWWHLMDGIESDLEAGDPESAYARAQTAARLTPRDPMVHGYRCEAAYAQEQFEAAAKSCRHALELAEDYPSRLGAGGLFRLRMLLADTLRNGLGDLPGAVRQYDILLAFPSLEEERRCEIQLAAGEAIYLTGEYDKAVRYFRDGATACHNEEDLDYLEHNITVLTGEAGAEAVARVQRYKLPGEELNLLDWRKKVRRDLARRLKTSAKARYSQEETWTPTHVSGPTYDVSVLSDGAKILTAQVNLWTRKIKVNLNVQ